jgi:hypothetical protein
MSVSKGNDDVTASYDDDFEIDESHLDDSTKYVNIVNDTNKKMYRTHRDWEKWRQQDEINWREELKLKEDTIEK